MPVLSLQLRESGAKVAAVVGPMADVESMVCLKDLFNSLGSEELFTEQGFPTAGTGTDLRSSYILNAGIAGIEVGVSVGAWSSDCPHRGGCVFSRGVVLSLSP